MATGRIGTNTVLTTRWSKAPAGGTTSLSGLDDNSVSLVYSVGYEQVYRNGVLLSRGNDYTATNGTTITLIDATITGDIIEVFANATIPLTDTYSQTVANGKFINNTLTTTTGDIIYASAANTPARLGIGSTDQVLKVTGGVPAWATLATGSTFVGAYATKTAAQTLTNNTDTILTWNAERFDTDGFHDNSTNNSRMTIPSGKGGKYLVLGSAYYVTGSGYRELLVLKNGNIVNYFYGVINTDYENLTINTIVECIAGDYLELRGFQNSGGNLNVNAGADGSFFSVTYLGA